MVLKKVKKKMRILSVLLVPTVIIIVFLGIAVYRSKSEKQIINAINNEDIILLQKLCQKPFANLDGKRPLSDFVITVLDGVPDEKPLKLAIKKGNLEMVMLLVENGADINYRRPYEKYYYMDSAICWGKADIVSFLADKNAKSRGEYSCLTTLANSVQRGVISIEDYKLVYDVLVNSGRIKNADGEQYWESLCSNSCFSVLQFHLKRGNIDIDYRFSDGASLLHRCVLAKDEEDTLLEFAMVLLAHGIDISICDYEKNTACDLANKRGFSQLAELISPRANKY